MQLALRPGDRSYDEAGLGYGHQADSVTLWQQRLDALVAKSPNAVYMPLPEGGEVAALVNEILDLVPETSEEQAFAAANKIFFHMFDVVGNRCAGSQ